MTLADIVALAKQGYKPADIKELLTMSETLTYTPQPTNQGDNTQLENPESEDTPIVEKPTEEKEAEDGAGVDYKLLYEETQNELKLLQQKNVNTNIQDNVNNLKDSDILNDLARSFM